MMLREKRVTRAAGEAKKAIEARELKQHLAGAKKQKKLKFNTK